MREFLIGRPLTRGLSVAGILLLFPPMAGAAAGAPPPASPDIGRSVRMETLASSEITEECTIAVLCAQATADGRPMLWKNRDTGFVDNEVVRFDDGAIPYLGLVSAGETDRVWMGVNEAGFAVMNALSHNLVDQYSGGITNGQLMKLALQTCATVDDFQALLIETGDPGRENPANLGVIDAKGGAALFEVGNFDFVRFDAADPSVAPGGFLARANFSLSADTTGLDTWRYRRARALCKEVLPQGARPADLLGMARDLASEAVDPDPLPYFGTPPGYPDCPGYILTEETIARRTSASGGVVLGVRPDEDPRLTIFLALVGPPAMTPVVPLWAVAGSTPPQVDGLERAPLCDLALQRKADCYDDPVRLLLLNTWKLCDPTSRTPGWLDLITQIDDDILEQVAKRWAAWHRDGFTPQELADAQAGWADEVYRRYLLEPGGELTADVPPIAVLASPNPGRGLALLRLEAAGFPPDGWGVRVFAPTGRLVTEVPARLISTASPLSVAEARWDGRDAGGGLVASGLYLLRPTWPEDARAVRYVLVR